jgi:hypothetical protein
MKKLQKVKYVGEIQELNGEFFEIPSEVDLGSAASYIESEYAMAKEAKAAEELDRVARTQVRTNRRKEKDAAVASLQQRLAALESNLKSLQRDQPDLLQLASTSANVASMIDSVHRLEKDAEVLNEQLEANMALVTQLADQSEEFATTAEDEREKTIRLIRANQQVVNQSFTTWTQKIGEFERRLTDMAYDLQQTATATRDAWDAVKTARSITDEAQAMARQAATEEIAARNEEFLGTIQLILKTLGITRSSALQTLNASKVDDAVVLTSDEIALAAQIYVEASKQLVETEQALDQASAESTDSSMAF